MICVFGWQLLPGPRNESSDSRTYYTNVKSYSFLEKPIIISFRDGDGYVKPHSFFFKFMIKSQLSCDLPLSGLVIIPTETMQSYSNKMKGLFFKATEPPDVSLSGVVDLTVENAATVV